MVGFAVNTTVAPVHVGLLPVVIATETAGTNTELMAIVMILLVAVDAVAQVAFEVIKQVTICPFVKDVVVNVAEFVPALTPSTFH